MPTVTPANMRVTAWDVTWNSVDLGGVDLVEPVLDMQWFQKRVGSYAGAMLDKVFQGLGDNAAIKVVVREVVIAKITPLVPWAGASAPYNLAPPLGTGIYQYAQQLLLHPRDQGVVTTEDVKFFKTVPVSSYQLKRNGVEFDAWEILFQVFPDHTKLASGLNAYWTIGNAA